MPRDISYDIADAAGITPQTVRKIKEELEEKLTKAGKIRDGKLISFSLVTLEEKRVLSCHTDGTSPPCDKGECLKLQGGVFA